MTDHAGGDYEYERRFLVTDRTILRGDLPNMLAQAYPFVGGGWSIRIRREYRYVPGDPPHTEEGPIQMAIKGPRDGVARREVEWELAPEIAIPLFQRSPLKVFKSRYHVIDAGTPWEVDVFHLDNEGLVIAECETRDAASVEALVPPSWCGEEITHDPRYNNEELARHPYRVWPFVY